MQAISSAASLPSAVSLLPSTVPSRTSELTRLKASTATHTDLSVVTAGGDRITLSAESLFRASTADLNYHRTDSGSSLDLHLTTSAIQVRNSIEVSVQGELDPQEEADVRQLVEKLEKVVTNFLGGDVEGAVSNALKISDLGTVASFQLNVQQSERIAISQETREQHPSADKAHSLGSPNERQGNTPSLANQLAGSIREANIESNRLLKLLPHALRNLFDRFDTTISDQALTQLASDIEAWLTGKPHTLDSATEPIITPA